MTTAMQQMPVVVQKDGTTHFIYHELIDLAGLGQVQIRRASQVEPDEDGCWWADLSPAAGPMLGPFEKRSDALTAEAEWLECHVINRC